MEGRVQMARIKRDLKNALKSISEKRSENAEKTSRYTMTDLIWEELRIMLKDEGLPTI
jgi:hypothetical protein